MYTLHEPYIAGFHFDTAFADKVGTQGSNYFSEHMFRVFQGISDGYFN